MMKVAGFCMWFWFAGAGFMLCNSLGGGAYESSSLVSGLIISEGDAMIAEGTTKSLKESLPHSVFHGESQGGDVILEDYRPYDPSPSSKASVRPGPIQHGTPLNPYIPSPKPSPPSPSDEDDCP